MTLHFEKLGHRSNQRSPAVAAGTILDAAVMQLGEYFAGERRAFEVPIDWSRIGEGFKRDVYRATMRVPYGNVVSYGRIARMLGKPRSARAVGTALSSAPLAVIVPAHRVVRADGELAGTSTSIRIRRALMELEGIEWD